jgi:hypothetical protein
VQQKLTSLKVNHTSFRKVTDPLIGTCNLSLGFVIGDDQARIPVLQRRKARYVQKGVDVIVEGRIGHDGCWLPLRYDKLPSYQDKKAPHYKGDPSVEMGQ